MRRIYAVLTLLTLSASAFSQTALSTDARPAMDIEVPAGTIQGQVLTTDNQPAAFVSVVIKGANKGTTTDERGFFTFRNLKEGTYTLEISMSGVKTQQVTVTLAKDQTVSVPVNLQVDARELSEVIIKAQKNLNDAPVSVGKVAIHPMDLPQSIAVIGQGVIRDQQAQRLSDVIRNVNGVYLATNRASTQENFSARGYALGNTNMFRNGSRVNSGAMPEISSLEKVEVLKGSAAILYGNVAPGGIINMVTKQPKFNFGGEVSVRAGSYNLFKPMVDVYGPISKSIAFRLNGSYESAESYRDVVESKRYYVNPSLLFKLGRKTELLVQGDYLKHDFTPDFGIGSIGDTTIPNLHRSAFLGTPWQYAKTEQATAGVTVRHQFNNSWKITFNASYQNYTRDYFSTERVQIRSKDSLFIRPLGRTDTNEDYVIGQVDLTGKFKTGFLEHTLLAGVDADRYMNSSYAFNNPATYDTIHVFDPSRRRARTDVPNASRIRLTETPTVRFGGYAQDLIKVGSKFNVLVGLRWSYLENRMSDVTDLQTKAETTTGKLLIDRAFSPRAGLVYKPFATTSVFVSYANSFSPNTNNAQTDIYFRPLDPSVIDQYEAGIKNEFFGGKLSVNLTAYRIINNNLVQTALFDSNGVVNTNTNLKVLAGETTSKGFEVDIAGQPISGLDIIAGYSYNDMRYTETPDGAGNFKEGQRLVNTPAHTANASVFYTFRKNGMLKNLRLGASAVYIGDRWGGWNDTKVAQGQPEVYRSRLIPVDGFTTLDLTAGYTYKKVSMLLKVSNVTNTLSYYVHENYSINPIPPRQLVATVSYRF